MSKKINLLIFTIVLLITITFFAGNQIISANLDDYLELELKFEGDIRDTSPNAIEGILHGASASYLEGIKGKAIALNGRDNYIDLGKSSALQPEDLTVSFWIKPQDSLSGEHMLMWNKPSGNWRGEGWYLSILNDSTPLLLSTGTNAQESFVSGNRDEFFPHEQWTHIAVSYDSQTGHVAIYRNGIAQEVLYTNKGSGIRGNNTDKKYLGFNSPAYDGAYAKLYLDEYKIYSKAVSAEEIRELYMESGGIITEEDIIQADLDNITIPGEVREDLFLRSKGRNGSIFRWESSNPDIISNTGEVRSLEVDTELSLSVTANYGDYSRRKDFDILVRANKSRYQVNSFEMTEVKIKDPYYLNAFYKNAEYLARLNPDRLLAGFKEIAGLEAKAERYDGWESTMIAGHTLGHYLTAISMTYKNSGDDIELSNLFRERIDYIIDELEKCQLANGNGYLFATAERHFDIIEGRASGENWVPWYTMHKIVVGLVDSYRYAENEKALELASNLGDWVYNRVAQWDENTQRRVLNVEYGGMNDAMYDLYKYTNNENHLIAAHQFDEISLFSQIAEGNDVLTNLHANTTIPKFTGALNRYRTLGEDELVYLIAAEQFWDIVINNHTYVTGGNSQDEHFRHQGQLDANRDPVNNETCNSYNMLKLTRDLFKTTADIKYADYYERTFINEIMASINPETGMTTYFKPMETGHFKVYSSEKDHFWCCTGSGMENFPKLDNSIYFHTDTDLYVNMYLSSILDWGDKGLVLKQEANLPAEDKVKFVIEAAPEDEVNIKFRSPAWIAEGEEITVLINEESLAVEEKSGYIEIKRIWNKDDIVELIFPMEVQLSRLPDNKNVVAFTYGPLVLSAGLGRENIGLTAPHGIQVLRSTRNVPIKDYILVNDENGVESWLNDVEKNIVKTEGKLEFRLRNTDEDDNLVFTPYYLEHEQRYGIYFQLVEKDSEFFQQTILESKEREKKADATIDYVQIKNDQHELQHNLKGNSAGGSFGGYNFRHANLVLNSRDGAGWFSYDMAVDSDTDNYLSAKYYSGDAGRSFNIYIDDNLLKEETVQAQSTIGFYDVRYEIPAEWIEGKKEVSVKFANRGASFVGGVFDTIYVLRAYDSNSELESVMVDGKEVLLSENKYKIVLDENKEEAMLNINPANRNALVYLDNILIDDTVDRKIIIENAPILLNVTVIAEDGLSEKKYIIEIDR